MHRNESSISKGLSTAFILIALFAGIVSTPVVAQTEQKGAIDWIFLIHTSASMSGHGAGAKDIFEKVKDTVKDFIHNARSGDSVSIFTFDRDIVRRPTVRIISETDRSDLLLVVDRLTATGNRTYTGKAIHDALERANQLDEQPDAATRSTSIILLTDGMEDVRGIPSPITVPSNIDLVPKNKPFIYFVSLGQTEHDQAVDAFVKDKVFDGRGHVLTSPGASGIEELAGKIRKTIVPATPKMAIKVDPMELDFGDVEADQISDTKTINVVCNVPTKISIRKDNSPDDVLSLDGPNDSVELSPNKPGQIRLRLKIKNDASPGVHSARFGFFPVSSEAETSGNTASVEMHVNVIYVPVWRKSIKWVALLLVVLLLVVVAICLVKGQTPASIWREFKERKWLEGELEIIRPQTARAEDAFVSLVALKRERASISELVPAIAADSCDAEFTSGYSNKNKFIKLSRTRGDVIVNKVQVAAAEVYDGDIIELGNVRLRFNWPGHDKPDYSAEAIPQD